MIAEPNVLVQLTDVQTTVPHVRDTLAGSSAKNRTFKHRGTIFNPTMLFGHGTAHVVQAQQLF